MSGNMIADQHTGFQSFGNCQIHLDRSSLHCIVQWKKVTKPNKNS
jgi:hypothetical protein